MPNSNEERDNMESAPTLIMTLPQKASLLEQNSIIDEEEDEQFEEHSKSRVIEYND